jgi:aspartate/methionine/tyrosine aminotransferase
MMSPASSSSSNGLENDDGDDTTTTTTTTVAAPTASPPSPSWLPPASISSRARATLDPCVILMKRMISKHARKWEAEGGIHSLAQGVVHWRPPDSAYEALRDVVRENVEATADGDRPHGGGGGVGGGGDGGILHTYCPDEGYPPLLAALAGKLRYENGLRDPHVIVTSGANQAYVNCVLTLLDEVDDDGNRCKCVVFSPYYFNHVMAVQSVRGDGGLLVGPTVRGVPDLGWLRARLEEHDYRGGVAAASGGGRGNAIGNSIRMVTLVNPGNPTGVSLPYAFLEEVMLLTKQYGVWLVVDNTYEHFDVEGRNTLPAGSGGDRSRDGMPRPDFPCFDEEHVINIFSFSKGYAMAGFRVGYVALSSKNGEDNNDGDGCRGRGTRAYEEMLKVQDTIAICTSRISQMAALGAMRSGREWVYERVRTLDAGRAAILGAMSLLEDVVGGNGAMYVMGKLPGGVDDQVSKFWERSDRLSWELNACFYHFPNHSYSS